MIIVLEGIDNAGKTTIAQMLVDYFSKKSKRVVVSKELTTKVGETIKSCIKSEGLSPISKAFLFAADRQIRIEELQNELRDGDVVIFDRYIHSAIVYREAEGVEGDWVKELNRNIPKSDVSIYIDITPEESIERNTDSKFNIHYSLEHLTKVRNAYLNYVECGELILVNGMKRVEDVRDEIVALLEKQEALHNE